MRGKMDGMLAGFIYTNIPTWSFTVESELSYSRAFDILTVAAVLRANDMQVDKAKSDILGCCHG